MTNTAAAARSVPRLRDLLALAACLGAAALPAFATPAPQAQPAIPQGAAAAPGPIRAEPAQKDFGVVKPHTTLKADFALVNASDQPVRIAAAVPSCQCTTLDLVGKTVPPRGRLAFPVTMKVSSTGVKLADVKIAFEGSEQLVRVGMKAEVAYPVRGVSVNAKGEKEPFIDAFADPTKVKGEVIVESLDGTPFTVLSVKGKPPVFLDWDPAQPPRPSYRVAYDVSPAGGTPVPPYLIIETSHPEARLIDMRVRHETTKISPRLNFAEFRANAGVISADAPGTFEIEIKDMNAMRVTGVQSKHPGVTAELVSQKADGKSVLATVKVTPIGPLRGVMLFPVTFSASQPGQTAPLTADLLVYAKAEQAAPAPAAAPAAPAAPAPPAQPTPPTPPAKSSTPGTTIGPPAGLADRILGAPAVPLDPRVNAGKMTTLKGAPAIPERIVQPLPAIRRIAERPEQVPISRERFDAAIASLDRGLAWLRKAQGPQGGWMETTPAAGTDQPKPSLAAPVAVSALAVKAFAQRGLSADPTVTRALSYVGTLTRRDGRFEPDVDGGVGNYVASAVAQALAAVPDGDHGALLQESVEWLKRNQWNQSQGIGPEQDWFGGSGYGNGKRPDLSNTQMAMDALHDAGVSPDDPAVQRALVFIARCQNLKATNGAEWAQQGSDDGGMIYSPANGGESMASDAAGEGRYGEKRPEGTPRSLRSYGSMTYAGFKSMLYAGLPADDPRVRAAFDWMRRHWTFDENPGLGAQGHFYYLHAMARALLASQQQRVADAAGAEHNWREELIDAIVKRQRADGSWANTHERWLEAKPELATVYMLLALEEALKPVMQAE